MHDRPMTEIEFAPGSRIQRDQPVPTTLPLLRPIPPATWIVFADGRGLGVPTDQIVASDEAGGRARVGFGGMRFDGVEEDKLVFRRAAEVWPEHALAPERGRVLKVAPGDVARVLVAGQVVWGTATPSGPTS
jgi:hypothetical protein